MEIRAKTGLPNRRGILCGDAPKNGRGEGKKTENQIPDIYETVRRWILRGRFSQKWKSNKGRAAVSVIFLVDSSGSMASGGQIGHVKKIVAETVAKNRQMRTEFAGVALENGGARIFCPLTTDAEKLLGALAKLKTGGKTNMSAAVGETKKLLRKKEGEKTRGIVYIFTDGKINFCGEKADPFEHSVKKFKTVIGKSVEATVVDTETGFVKIGMAAKFSEATGARYMRANSKSAGR